MQDFEWDEEKAQANRAKHGVSFEDAALVFQDEDRIEWLDEKKDYGEDRYTTVGLVKGRILFVVYTERAETLRLIMARRATKTEQRKYYGDRTI